MPDDHPLCGGPVGMDFGSIAGADVMLAIGVRFEEILSYGRGSFYAPDLKVISVDIEPTEMGRNRPIDLGIWGDAKAVLTQLIEPAKEALSATGAKREDTEWVQSVKNTAKSIEDILRGGASSSDLPIHPGRLGKEVCEFLGKDSYIVMDGGDINAHVTPLFQATFPGSFISGQGSSLGHLGGGIPYAIGVKTAKPDKRVLCITGDGLARGYHNNPELTNEKFLGGGGWQPRPIKGGSFFKIYKTGDLARWLADGNIEFLGRIDHQVKLRGFRIELREIEWQILKHELVREAVVLAGEEENGGRYLCAYIVSREVFDLTDLKAHLSKSLQQKLAAADLIICKGMANYEAFSETAYRPIVYLLKVKCQSIAEDMHLPLGIHAVKLYTH